MKKMLKVLTTMFLAIMLVGLFTTMSFAAESTLTTDVLADAVGLLNANYEMKASDSTTFFISGVIGSNGAGFSGGLNYYVNEKPLDGFFLGGGLCFLSTTELYVLSIDARLGYKKILDNNLVLEGSFGIFEGINFSVGMSF
jgi:hypothetical protein